MFNSSIFAKNLLQNLAIKFHHHYNLMISIVLFQPFENFFLKHINLHNFQVSNVYLNVYINILIFTYMFTSHVTYMQICACVDAYIAICLFVIKSLDNADNIHFLIFTSYVFKKLIKYVLVPPENNKNNSVFILLKKIDSSYNYALWLCLNIFRTVIVKVLYANKDVIYIDSQSLSNSHIILLYINQVSPFIYVH